MTDQGNPYQHNPYGQQPGQASYGHQPGYEQSSQPGYGQSSEQPGYGQSSQPGYGQSSAQPGYPQPSQTYGQGAQHGYPQQQAGYPSPQQAYAYGQAPAGYQAPTKRSPVLGMIALGVVLVCGVIFTWLMWNLGVTGAPLFVQAAGDQEVATQLLLDQLGTTGTVLLNVSTYGGFAAWVAAIVATATNRGRAYGIWGIVMGVLSPVIAVVAFIVAIAMQLN